MGMVETKLNALEDIKLRALYIEKRFMSHDPEETILAESELTVIQDHFCEDYRDFVTPPMARALRKDFNTFLVVIEWALEHYRIAGD